MKCPWLQGCIGGIALVKDGSQSYNDDMRILFVSATRIGDAVLSTGVLSHLVDSYPGARITVACGPAAASLFATVPGLDQVIILEKMIGSLHWLRLWGLTVWRFWDIVVDLRSAPLTYVLFARKHYHLDKRKHKGHRLRQIAAVLKQESCPPFPKLWSHPDIDARAAKLISRQRPTVAIGPTANWRAKTWRSENFSELCVRITAPGGLIPGANIAVFGAAEERPQIIGLLETISEKQCVDLVGRVSLLEAFACLKRCSVYIGNDSGLMHIAAASGVPTLGVFGPSKEELYGPIGPLTASVRTPSSFDDIHPEGFDHKFSDSLMDGLTVDHVFEALSVLWSRAQELSH
ncbi:MAG: hypothetical protein CBB68_03040 [Rhodospirillaceae bacterium TMED8]|nr:MAG: hypothetical protein CBB68_03040 [Rhodospirillaceae bacterium TMED8]